MSSRYIQICDICGNEIDTKNELYKDLNDDTDIFKIREEFRLPDKSEICQSCTEVIKDEIFSIIKNIRTN